MSWLSNHISLFIKQLEQSQYNFQEEKNPEKRLVIVEEIIKNCVEEALKGNKIAALTALQFVGSYLQCAKDIHMFGPVFAQKYQGIMEEIKKLEEIKFD